jgi:hypothetical protein
MTRCNLSTSASPASGPNTFIVWSLLAGIETRPSTTLQPDSSRIVLISLKSIISPALAAWEIATVLVFYPSAAQYILTISLACFSDMDSPPAAPVLDISWATLLPI